MDFKYEVALSYASEQRDYVVKVAEYIRKCGISVFYDEFKKVELSGGFLPSSLEVFRNSKCCVIFISNDYKIKKWPAHEYSIIFERIFQDENNFILIPVRFDDTVMPGLSSLIRYEDANKESAQEVAEIICRKIGKADFILDQYSDLPLSEIFALLQRFVKNNFCNQTSIQVEENKLENGSAYFFYLMGRIFYRLYLFNEINFPISRIRIYDSCAELFDLTDACSIEISKGSEEFWCINYTFFPGNYGKKMRISIDSLIQQIKNKIDNMFKENYHVF